MRWLSSIVATISWSLWFGALMALFIFVQALFGNDREIAKQAAPQLFMVYQKYHLILACVALAAAVGWRIAVPSKAAVALFILLALAACSGVAVAMWIIGPMEQLRRNGESGSPQFMRLHGRSMMLYVSQAALLLAAGIALVFALRSSNAQTSRQTAAA